MSNTLSSSLVLDSISRTVITPLGNLFSPLSLFCTDFSDENYTKGQNVRLRYATSGPSVQTNPTNWESGNSVQDNVNLIVNHYSVSWQITPDEVEKGFALDQLALVAYQSIAAQVMNVAFTPLTTTNFANITVAQASLAVANLRTIRAAIAKAPQKNLLLDSTSYAQFLPSNLTNDVGIRPGFCGFDRFSENTDFSGAGTNVYGFAGHKGALGFISGLPKMDSEVMSDINSSTLSIKLSGNGTGQEGVESVTMPMLASTWIARSTRLRWASLDVMFGATKIQNTACRILLSA